MTPADRGPLRIALLHDDSSGGDHASELADGLDRAGHDAELVRASTVGALESLLRRRGFAGSLTRVPAGLTALLRDGFDIVHAFSTTDAAAALAWRRLAARPAVAVFTCVEPLDRARLADRRLRLWLLERAVRDSDAVTAATEASRAELARWLALDAPVIESGDAAGYERLYHDLLDRRT